MMCASSCRFFPSNQRHPTALKESPLLSKQTIDALYVLSNNTELMERSGKLEAEDEGIGGELEEDDSLAIQLLDEIILTYKAE